MPGPGRPPKGDAVFFKEMKSEARRAQLFSKVRSIVREELWRLFEAGDTKGMNELMKRSIDAVQEIFDTGKFYPKRLDPRVRKMFLIDMQHIYKAIKKEIDELRREYKRFKKDDATSRYDKHGEAIRHIRQFLPEMRHLKRVMEWGEFDLEYITSSHESGAIARTFVAWWYGMGEEAAADWLTAEQQTNQALVEHPEETQTGRFARSLFAELVWRQDGLYPTGVELDELKRHDKEQQFAVYSGNSSPIYNTTSVNSLSWLNEKE
jgi:hypothetical protein